MGKREDAIAQAQLEAAAQAVMVTTGEIQAKYQPLNIVFAVGGSAGGLFRAASAQEAFEKAMRQLQIAAVRLGGNGVVACSFGYNAITQQGGCGGSTFTVHGYGTVVRFV